MKRPTIDMLLAAYTQGVFPMAHPEHDDEIYWYAPDPRAIIDLDEFKTTRRLRQTIRKEVFEIRINTAFEEVIDACAAPRGEDQETWISSGISKAYIELHHAGFAHSVEAWKDGVLAGGLYGVSVGGMFAGESMFHRVTDASKVALVGLIQQMRAQDLELLDIQFMTDHLATFGAKEVSKDEYEERLIKAIQKPCAFAPHTEDGL